MKADSQNRSLEAALARLNNSVDILIDITDKQTGKNEKNKSDISEALQKMIKQNNDAKSIAKEQRNDKADKSKTLATLKQLSENEQKSRYKSDDSKIIQQLDKSAKNFNDGNSIVNKLTKTISNGLNALGGVINGAFDAVNMGLNALHSMLPQSLQKVLGPAFKVLTFTVNGIKKAFNIAFSVVKKAWKVFSDSLIGKLTIRLSILYLIYKFFTSGTITNWISEKLNDFYIKLQDDNSVFGKIAKLSISIKDILFTVADSIAELVVFFKHSSGFARCS